MSKQKKNKRPKQGNKAREPTKSKKQMLQKKEKQPTPSPHLKEKVKFPHFRYYKKNKHPVLIVGEQIGTNQVDEWKFRKVMHSEKDGRHLNEKVYPNPNPSDKKPMYIANRVRHDKKTAFENKSLPWKYPSKKKK